MVRKIAILDHFTSFSAILAILDDFGQALNVVQKDFENFEIIAKSLILGAIMDDKHSCMNFPFTKFLENRNHMKSEINF